MMRIVLLCSLAVAVVVVVEGSSGHGCGSCRLKKFLGEADSSYGDNDAALFSSTDMDVVKGGQCVKVPLDDLEQFLLKPSTWCSWTGLFGSSTKTELAEGQQLNIVTNIAPPSWESVYETSTIKKVSKQPGFVEFGWIYQNKGITGRMTVAAGSLDTRVSCVMLWQKASGSSINAKAASDSFQCQASALHAGIRCLEYVFSRDGALTEETVRATCASHTKNACDKTAASVQSCLSDLYERKGHDEL